MSNFDTFCMDKMEAAFIAIFSQDKFDSIYGYIVENDLTEHYNKSRLNPDDLCQFGFHFGILEIVQFCYCHLKILLDIHGTISGHYKQITTDIDESTVCADNGSRGHTGITFSTFDKYSKGRMVCANFLVRMINYSKYTKRGKTFVYQIMDKYAKCY